jgi:hypothetical protein
VASFTSPSSVRRVSVRRWRWRRGEKLAGLGGELLQAAFQFLAAQFPVFRDHFPFHFGQRRQGPRWLHFFFHGSSFRSLSAG